MAGPRMKWARPTSGCVQPPSLSSARGTRPPKTRPPAAVFSSLRTCEAHERDATQRRLSSSTADETAHVAAEPGARGRACRPRVARRAVAAGNHTRPRAPTAHQRGRPAAEASGVARALSKQVGALAVAQKRRCADLFLPALQRQQGHRPLASSSVSPVLPAQREPRFAVYCAPMHYPLESASDVRYAA